jgi:ATP:ADP antiporter, AAA family
MSRFERFLGLFTSVQPGDGRCVGWLGLQAFTLMAAYYLVRPVREALILTEGTAELRSYAVGAQALLLILLVPPYAALVRRLASNRVFRSVIAFFAVNLVAFAALGLSGFRISFGFFVWAGVFAVMAVTQFWAFATDLLDSARGTRLFGVIAVGVSAGAWAGSKASSIAFDSAGPCGLMLASAGVLCVAIGISEAARRSAPRAEADPPAQIAPHRAASNGAGAFELIARSRFLAGIAVLVVLLNWITSTGDFVLSSWLADVARERAPDDPGAFIGRFMGEYCSAVTLAGFLVQLLLVSRIINVAGLARALVVTPFVFFAGFLAIGILPAFALLQSVLVVQRSLDYSLLNTARSALLLPTTRQEKYLAKTTIDTLFYRLGDLLSAGAVFVGTRFFPDERLAFVWLVVVLSATMTAVAWLVGREYSRRFQPAGRESGTLEGVAGPRPVLAQ